MKRKIFVLGMVMCLLMSPSIVWGNTNQEIVRGVVTPRYAYVDMINTIFGISEGRAACAVTVYENLGKTFDYSRLTVYLKKSSGATVKTWTSTMYPSSANYFNWTKTYALTSRGTYYIQAVNKLYKNGSLVETITTTSVQDTY